MEATLKTHEEVVSEVLTATYPRFAYSGNKEDDKVNREVLEGITTVLGDSKKVVVKYKDFESPAAYEVRMILLTAYPAGRASVTATVQIFNALDRREELGWLAM
jgi:hypothetical protein